MTDQAPGWVIVADCLITRRKYFHLLMGPDGRTHYRSRLLCDVVAYLAAEEVDAYTLTFADAPHVFLSCTTKPRTE